MNNNPVTMATITPNRSVHQLRTSSSSHLSTNEDMKLVVSESSGGSRQIRTSFTCKREEEDGDIGVFEAHNYFNGGIVEPHDTPRLPPRQYQYHHKDEQQQQQQQQQQQKTLESRNLNKSNYGTPSVRSESSWNSQSKLLPRIQRNPSRNKNGKIQQKKGFLAGLGCKCYCADDNSVDTSEHNHNSPNYGVVHAKAAHKDSEFSAKKPDLSFSAVNSGLDNLKLQPKKEEDNKPRKSLEVFGSPILNSKRSLTFDKRLTMPSSKVEEIDIFSGNHNDSESDASSDLFEIDSLTGKSTNNLFLNRQTSEVIASGCASPTTTCYAPSEASIEWSVATASAADFAVLSDGEEQITIPTTKSTYISPTTKASREIQRQRRHSSTLLGCKSYKAVKVAGDAFITYEKPNHSPLIRRRSDTLAQVTRFKADPKIGNVGAIHGQQHGCVGQQHGYVRQPLPRSYSSHVSQPLYI